MFVTYTFSCHELYTAYKRRCGLYVVIVFITKIIYFESCGLYMGAAYRRKIWVDRIIANPDFSKYFLHHQGVAIIGVRL
jgi:hypothetical protein